MSVQHSTTPWKAASGEKAADNWLIASLGQDEHDVHWYVTTDLVRASEYYANPQADAYLMSASPDLLVLAHQYASECGDCLGTRVCPLCPDDEPCHACADIWAVINKAEGRQ